jgi:hypothetical protein
VTSETLEEAIARNEQPLAAAAATRVVCVCARKWSEPWPKCPACAERSDAAEAGLRAVMVVEEEEEVERATAVWETAAAAAAIAIAERKKQEAGGGAGEGKGGGRGRG